MSSQLRFRKPMIGLVALAVMSAVTLGQTSGYAGSVGPVPPRDQVHRTDLPTAHQVARIYPYFKGGSRAVYRNRDLDIRSADCMSWVLGGKAASGRWASYFLRGGAIAYFHGKADPGAFVYKFSTLSDAHKAMRIVRKSIRRCEGAHVDGVESVTSHEVTVPRLGATRIAYRERLLGFRTDPTDADYFLEIWARDGRYLINASAQKDPNRPAKAPVVRLARLILRTAG